MNKHFPVIGNLPIAFKLSAGICALVFFVICILSAVFFNNQSRLIRAHAYDFSTLITEQLASNAVEPLFTDEQYELQALVKLIAANDRILGAAIFDTEGLLVANDGMVPEREFLNFSAPYQELGPKGKERKFKPAEAISVHIEPVRFKGVTAGYAVASYSQAALARSSHKSLAMIAGIAAVLCSLLYFVVCRLILQITNPIKDLLSATKKIHAGQFEQVDLHRNDELGQLMQAINSMGSGLEKKSQLESLMDQMLTKNVADEVRNHLDTIKNGGHQIHASVLFADIVGFTTISEQLSPREVSELLNEYFTFLESCAKFYYGTIDKFIGDCVMVVFGTPKEDPQHEFHAIACGVLMQKLIKRLNEQRLSEGKFTVDLRIGINSGSMLAGLLGSAERLEYTVVGDAVNLASRLCNEANKSQIIIEESMFERISATKKIYVEQHKEIRVRGKSLPISIYNVCDVEQMNPMIMETLISDVISARKVA